MQQSEKLTSDLDYLKAKYELEKDLDEINVQKTVHDNRPSWEDTYFEIAKVASRRSKDPKTKVGACLVKNGRVIGIGYNGEPREYSYKFNWNTEEKYDYVIHAEMNAIANACSIGADVSNSIIYLTLSPCCECIKLLIQFNIKEVHFIDKYKDFDKVKNIAKYSQLKLFEKN